MWRLIPFLILPLVLAFGLLSLCMPWDGELEP